MTLCLGQPRSAAILAATITLLSFTRAASAQEADAPRAPAVEKRADALFPASGHVSMSLATGIPFLVMSEVAVGIGDRFALGGLAGIAMSGDGPPTNVGFGVRPRVAVIKTDALRLEVVAPTLYYPKTNGTWFLSRPSVQLERTFESGAGAYVGAGVVMVVDQATLLGKAPSGAMPYGGTPGKKAGDASNGIWNTVSAGGAIPLGKKTHLFGEAALILNGLSLPGNEWVGGVPFTATLGVATAL